ncbi:MAG: PKD domain-containing protein [Solirubrobacterales bacterium]
MPQRLLPNGFLTAAVAALLLGSPWVSAAGADAAQVTVVSPGGTEQTLSLAALAGSEDLVGRSYALRSSSGESSQALTGFSLAKVLEAAGADPFGFSYLEAQRPAGGAVVLSRHQALDADAFADGPPLVYAAAEATGFLRPSSGPDDLNAGDFFEAPQGITLILRKGEPLQIRAQASTLRTSPGKPIEFGAIVDRAGSGEQLAYSWYFDDGHSASGAGASHSFAKPGSYDVVLGVTTPGDEAGASDVVTIQVGPPPSGPNRKGGGTNEDAAAPDHGAATGSESATPGPPSSAPAIPAAAAEQRPPSRQQAKPSPLAGEPVSGELLSTTAAAPEAKPTVAARTGRLDGDGSGGGVPGAAIGILTALGLLGFGALVEVRGIGNLLPGRL